MDLKAVVSTPSTTSALPGGGGTAPDAQDRDDAACADTLETLRHEKEELEQKLLTSERGRVTNTRAYKVTRLLALGGGALFITGAFMASMAPFVAGAAVGALSYIASGWFHGRSQWFTREAQSASEEVRNVQKEYRQAEEKVEKARTELNGLAAGLGRKDPAEKIIDDDDFIMLDGIRLEKKQRHLGDVIDDLFRKLPDKKS